MNGTLMDMHGAGCQRSDPKNGNASDYLQYMGPQGDVRYLYNYVRCVRNIEYLNLFRLPNFQKQPQKHVLNLN